MRMSWVGLAAVVAVGCGGKVAEPKPPASVAPPVAPAPQEVVLAVSVSGDGVIRGPGVECRSTCTQRVVKGTHLALQAVADQGATLDGFSGACTGQTCELTLDADAAVAAKFTRPPPPPIEHRLTVQVDGHGSVRSSPNGIDCGNTCGATFVASAQVALTPAADAGYAFAGWSAGCSGAGACIVMMSDDAHVIARFDPLPPKMAAVSVSVNGPGKVTGNGIDCPGSTCSVQVAQGTLMSLTATPNTGARFSSFGGACSGKNCSVAASDSLSISATFENEVIMLAPADGTNSNYLGINATHLFYQRYGNNIYGIWSVPKGGGTPSMLTSGTCCATNIVADQDYVYWADYYSINRVPIAGGATQRLYSTSGIGNFVLDGATIYWTQYSYGNQPNGIYTGSASGGQARLLSPVNAPVGLAVDSQSVYWTDKQGDGVIKRQAKAGGAVETVINCGTCNPQVVRVDFDNIYYRNTDGDGWSRAKSGGDFHKLTSGNPGSNYVFSVNLEINASVAYWTWMDGSQSGKNGLYSARADGTGWTALDIAPDSTWSRPVVDDNYIFYFHAGALYRRLK